MTELLKQLLTDETLTDEVKVKLHELVPVVEKGEKFDDLLKEAQDLNKALTLLAESYGKMYANYILSQVQAQKEDN